MTWTVWCILLASAVAFKVHSVMIFSHATFFSDELLSQPQHEESLKILAHPAIAQALVVLLSSKSKSFQAPMGLNSLFLSFEQAQTHSTQILAVLRRYLDLAVTKLRSRYVLGNVNFCVHLLYRCPDQYDCRYRLFIKELVSIPAQITITHLNVSIFDRLCQRDDNDTNPHLIDESQANSPTAVLHEGLKKVRH